MVTSSSVEHPPQGLKTVLRAELARDLRQGGLRVGVTVTSALGLIVGLSAIVVIAYLSQGTGSLIDSTVPVEASSSTVAIVLSISVLLYYSRSAQNGATLTALMLVPVRLRLFLAQALATASLGLTIVLAVSTLVAGVALVVSSSESGLLPALTGVLSGCLAVALTALLAMFLAVLVGRPIPALFVYIAWWVVLPLALPAIILTTPSWLAAVLTPVVDWTPTVLLSDATTVSTLRTQGLAPLLRGLAGLGAWSAALGVMAFLTFRRRSV